jgi:UDP-glucose:(heptosyl)LPS alpha-1,3-glucosyltransferase
MKVTICCKRFGPGGGAEKFLASLVRSLLDGRHRVKVMAAEVGDDPEGVEVVPLSVPPVPRAFRDLALARAAERALEGDDSEVTFSDQKCWGARAVRPGGGVQHEYARQRIRMFRSPFRRALRRLRDAVSIRDRLRLYVEDRLYRGPTPELVIANSEMVRGNLEQHYPHLAGRIRVIYNGVDPGRFHPRLRRQHRRSVRQELGIPADAAVALFVGTGWRRKGLRTFLAALGMVSGAGSVDAVHGIVVGRGNERAAKAFARRRGAERLVRFVGSRPPEPYYGASDFLVLPSYFDPCANVTLEALGCGLPVVTTVHNGAHELLTHGQNGFRVECPSDAPQVAAYIERCADESWRQEASASARAVALEHTLEQQFGQIIDAMRALPGSP